VTSALAASLKYAWTSPSFIRLLIDMPSTCSVVSVRREPCVIM
jgi:hypothetical protein